MKFKVDRFSATSPNPVLRVDKDGTVFYSNKAGEPLLKEWGAGVGEKLPSGIGDLVQRVISQNSPEKMEFKVGKRVYLTVFHPLHEEKFVCISGFDISGQKEFDEQLRESEIQEIENLELSEIIDIQTIQPLMDDLYKLTHIPIGINDLKGNVLVSVGWQDVCAKYHRVHPETRKHCIESDKKLSSGVLPREFKLYKCKNNMYDIVTPIMVGSQHVGYVFGGQFFFDDEPLDYELFRSQARKYGFNEEKYIAALEKVPLLSRKTVETGMSFFMTFANMLSQLNYSNIKLAKSLSERDTLLEALQESEEKYRNIVETAKEGIIIIDNEAIITYTNKRLADMLGYTRGEGIGRPIWDFISEESKDIVKLNLKNRCLDTNDSYKLNLIKKDGSVLWALVNAKPLFDKNGKFMGSMSMLTDITESKMAEMALKENESRFRNLFEVITSGVVIFDVIDHGHDFIFQDMNPAYERIFHVKRENIIGKSLYEIFPDADKMGLNEAFRWVWVAGQQEFLPLTLNVDKNITSWLTANVFRLPSGELVAVFEDITERKQAFEEREQLLDYILQEKDRLVALVNSITDEVWFADTHKNFSLINPSALNAFNVIDEGEVTVEKLPASLEVYRPDGSLRPKEEAPSLRALQGEIVKNQEEIVRTPVYGELRYRQVCASPVHDTCGNIIGSVSVVRDITENKRAEAALHKSEEQYRTLFNTMNEGFCIIEMLFDENEKPIDYVFVETNPAFEKQTGFSNVVGKRIRELIPANEDYWFERYGKVALTGESARFENSTGALHRSYEVYAYRIGQPTSRKVAIIFNDITERKKAGEALKESEEKYRNIVETANEGISIIDAEDKVTYANKKIEDMNGYSTEEIIGKSIWDFISEESKPIVKLILEKGWQGFNESLEIKYIRKDGSPLWAHTNAKSLFDKDGKFIGSLNMHTDITKRKEAEEKLRESEEKYRNIVETANEGISLINAEAKITYFNKKMEDLVGYSQEESIGKSILDFISEEFKTIVKLNLERRLQGINESIEIKLIRKDGSPIWVNINTKSIFDKTGAFIGSMNMLTDVTKRKEAEQALANLELARKKEIHHRIKNNLQVISSLLDLQAEKFKDRENIKDSEVLEAFRESQSRVISMALIHEELHRGGGFETLNFSAYIEELSDNLLSTYRLGNTDISLNRDLEGDLFLNMDTAIPLGIIINELISNSFKHAFPGRDKGEIRIKLHRVGKGDFIDVGGESKFENCKSTILILSVSDNGVGIPENFDIENLDSLGLQLVTSLVEQLDGGFEIKRNYGTEFIIRFIVTEKNDKASAPVPISYGESPKFLH